jgi:hypothetical protein
MRLAAILLLLTLLPAVHALSTIEDFVTDDATN